MISLLLLLALTLAVPEPRPPAKQTTTQNPEATAFFAERDANADVDLALAEAKVSGKMVVVIMGANWCHDSVGLAGWLDTPRFLKMIKDRYEVVYVDVGTPQTGNGRNLDIARRFGIKKVKGTPLVMLMSADGALLNSRKDAASWRNAANRDEDAIFAYFADFKPRYN